MDEPRTEKESATILAQLKELVAEAKSGNPEVLPQIRQILKQFPALAQHFGDLWPVRKKMSRSLFEKLSDAASKKDASHERRPLCH